VARPFATLAAVAQARLRHAGRRLGVRIGLIAGCAAAGSLVAAFGLAALTVALAERVGAVRALLIVALAALAVLLILIGALAIEARRGRQMAARRSAIDARLLRSAVISSAIPRVARLPSRATLGLGLVALGTLLVLARRGAGDEGD
jgi:hypothetical protein